MLQSWSLSCALLQEMWAEQDPPGEGSPALEAHQEEEGAVLWSSPQNHGLSVCPAHPSAPQTPGATATVNQAAGQWAAGPGQWAGLDLL